jgi:ferredoxin
MERPRRWDGKKKNHNNCILCGLCLNLCGLCVRFLDSVPKLKGFDSK